jgi:hypothetical protein
MPILNGSAKPNPDTCVQSDPIHGECVYYGSLKRYTKLVARRLMVFSKVTPSLLIKVSFSIW